MRLDQAIDLFLEHIRVERGLSDRSQTSYRGDLERLWGYLTEDGADPIRLEDVGPLHVKDFVAHLRDDRGYKPRSLSRAMSTLRVFFGFLVRRGKITKDPAASLHNPKTPRKLPVYLVEDEMRRILAVHDPGAREGERNRTILVVFLFTGLRLSELVGLNWGDVDFGSGVLLVRGKGAKERLTPMHALVSASLKQLRPPAANSGDAAVFVDGEGTRLTPRQAGYIVRKAVEGAGLSRRITPHKLRHTFATQLLRRGASLIEIKELLGHSDISTTSIYTHTNVERLRRAVDRIDMDG